jgi:ABC-type antimicrobial peptide transport system permease subunit
LAIATDSSTVRTVVGVVDDVLMGAPFSRSRSDMAIYVPLRQTATADAEILFRHRGDAGAAQAALYAALAFVDARIVPPDVSTYEEILDKSASIAKFVTSVFALCFGFALLLAVSGTYALMARAIAQRTREIGIRRALGATDDSVSRLLLSQGARQLGVGVAIALPVMLAIGYGFWNFFPIAFGVSAGSALAVSATIVGAVLVAAYVPTRQALRISPRDALGSD